LWWRCVQCGSLLVQPSLPISQLLPLCCLSGLIQLAP
jgi:hypothetical protein